ncbi:unnamed protein product [Mortierella alpina]
MDLRKMGPPLSRSARSPLSLARPSFAHWALSAFLVAVTILPSFTHADIICNTFKDTFRLGDTLKFTWSDTQTYTISDFNLDLYCVETGKLVRTLATLNTNSSESPVEWTVDGTIQAGAGDCPRHQYSASFDWHYNDPTTLEAKVGTASCNRIMLFIPAATTPSAATPDPGDASNTDDPPSGQIFISDKTKTIIIGVGGAVGALIVAGFVGFYFIRYKNRRAEESAANRKLREPLHASSAEEGGSSGSLTKNKHDTGDGTRYSALTSVTTTLPGDKMELDTMGSSYSTASGPVSGSHLPMMTEHTSQRLPLSSTPAAMRHSMQSDMSGPLGSFTNERPTSLLTSSFTPPAEDEQRLALRARQREEQERQHYEEQLHQQQHQQQQQQQHQQQQQQQQQNFGSYPF